MGRQSKYEHYKQPVLDAIADLTRKEGKPPSLREVAKATDVSVATLHSYIQRLRDDGLIEWRQRGHRSLRVKQPHDASPVSAGPVQPTAPQPTSPPPTPAPAPVPAPVSRMPDPAIDPGF